MRRGLLVFGVAALATACDGPSGPDGRAGFALSIPTADASEIASIGFFAVDLDASLFECSQYRDGSTDPIAEYPETVVAAQIEYVEALAEGDREVFTGIPPGHHFILVECYGAGGGRLFLGCGDADIVEGETAHLEIDMVEDPLLGT